MKIAAIILTLDEELHIQRCINSISDCVDEVFVVDSGSVDKTVDLAKKNNCTILVNDFSNQAQQFNWALGQLPASFDWVFRLDADEYLDETAKNEIKVLREQSALPDDVDGFSFLRSMYFMGDLVKRGCVGGNLVLRLFKRSRGRCEHRWMDEHIVVKGRVRKLSGRIYDNNLKSLSFWLEKHNKYASREAVEMLNIKYHFLPDTMTKKHESKGHVAGFKRFLKQSIYSNLPSAFRAAFYFLYRYILSLGVLDTRGGRAFHVLQGFWYRYLVDKKVAEVLQYRKQKDCDIKIAIAEKLGIHL